RMDEGGRYADGLRKKVRVRQRLHGKAGQGHDGHAHYARAGAGHGGDQSLHEYESAFASVRKTVDATEAEYEQFSDAIKKMSTEVAADAADIAEVMANAGQLGIQNDYLVEFTRT